MDFNQANREYTALKQALGNGTITQQDFSRKVEQLRVKAEGGVWWKLDDKSGNWLFWDGQSWVWPQNRPQSSDKSKVIKKEEQNAPKTLLQLLWVMIKGFFKNIPKIIKSQMIRLIIIFIAVFIINAYLVVVKNEGFSPTGGNKWLPITALPGLMKSATIFWAFAAFFISNIIGRIKSNGLKIFFGEIFGFPGFLSKNFQDSNKKGLVTFLVMIAVTLPLTLLFKNSYLLILYGLMAFFSYTTRENGFLLYVFKLGSDDLRKILKRKGAVNPSLLYIMVFSVAVTFFLSYVLPWKPYSIIILSIMLIVLAILRHKNSISPGAVTAVLTFAVTNIVLLKITGQVYADDGGWQEAGGTFDRWINSQGAGRAVSMGFPPALGALLGTFLGGFGSAVDLSSTLSGIDLNSGWDGKTPPDEETLRNIQEQIDNTVRGEPGELYEPNNENRVEWSADLIKNILGTSEGMDMLGRLLRSTSLGEFAGDAVDAFQSFMRNNMVVNEFGELVFQGDNAKRMQLIKDMVNSSRANQILSGVNRGLFWGGAFVDAMMNYAIGDGAVLAGTKALSNAYLMGALGDKNPALGVMELANFILCGGSQAADCISPSKTITGAVNLAYDMMFKDPKEWQDRLASGVYGPNIQNFAEGAGIAMDAYSNPQQFWNEFSSAVQIDDINGDMWTDMYQSSFELWNLPDNVNTDLSLWHPLDSARTIGCAVGHQVTNGVIAIGEGAARFGQYLGDAVGSNATLDRIVTTASDAAGAVYDTVSNAAGTAFEAGKNIASSAADVAMDMAGNAYDRINDLSGGAVDSAVDMAGRAVDSAVDMAGRAADAIADTAGSVAGAVKDGAGYAIDKVNSAVDATVDAVGNAGSRAWNYLGSWFK